MPRARAGLTVEERFWSKVRKDESGCWLWTDVPANTGYGMFSVEGRSRLAHRFAYELLVGPIPAGLTLDHLCHVRHCVNPEHLEPVTQAINVGRGRWAHSGLPRAEFCKRGHRYADVGFYIRPDTGTASCNRCCLDRALASTHREDRRRRLAEEQGPEALRKYVNRRNAQLGRQARTA